MYARQVKVEMLKIFLARNSAQKQVPYANRQISLVNTVVIYDYFFFMNCLPFVIKKTHITSSLFEITLTNLILITPGKSTLLALKNF